MCSWKMGLIIRYSRCGLKLSWPYQYRAKLQVWYHTAKILRPLISSICNGNSLIRSNGKLENLSVNGTSQELTAMRGSQLACTASTYSTTKTISQARRLPRGATIVQRSTVRERGFEIRARASRAKTICQRARGEQRWGECG